MSSYNYRMPASRMMTQPMADSIRNNMMGQAHNNGTVTDFSATMFPPRGGSRDTMNVLIRNNVRYRFDDPNIPSNSPYVAAHAIQTANGQFASNPFRYR